MAKLKRIRLENYRNIKSLTLEVNSQSGKIIGANRVGKTNVLEAICYLLTDKLLGGSSDIQSIKPLGNTRARVVVEGTFLTSEGEVTLRKEFYEKWVRPRGSSKDELAGHSTDYYVNGAKQSRATDYQNALSEKFGIPTSFNNLDTYQFLIDPFYLAKNICASKDWKLARKLVIDIVGEVDPDEIFQTSEETKIAKADLEAHQFDEGEAKKAIRGEIDGFKKRILTCQSLLDEFNRVGDVDDEEYKQAEARKEEIANIIARLQLGAENPYAEEERKLLKELHDLQDEYDRSMAQPEEEAKTKKLKLAMDLAEAEWVRNRNELADLENTIKRQQRYIDGLQADQEITKGQLRLLKDKILGLIVEDTCPTCGQKLPPEEVERAYNKRKAELTEQYNREHDKAVGNKNEIARLKDDLVDNLNPRFQECKEKVEILSKSYTDCENAYQKSIHDRIALVNEGNPILQKRMGEIHKRLDEIDELNKKGTEDVDSQIRELKSEALELNDIFAKRLEFENAQKRLKEINSQIEIYGGKQADAEQRLWAVDEFVKTKLSLLDKHMASKLGEVRFQLVKENIKAGSYDEVCVPYIISPKTKKHTETLFSDGSMSEQIYTGTQIIKAVRDNKEWASLPILFDQGGELDGESSLIVSEEAEAQTLAVRVEGESKAPTFVPFVG